MNAPTPQQGSNDRHGRRGPAFDAGPIRPVYVLTRGQARRLDEMAESRFGIPVIVLMENAGLRTAEAAHDLIGEQRPAAALVVCGPGNNGGDGLVAARHLHNAGVFVRVVTVGGPEARRDAGSAPGHTPGPAAINREIVARMGIPCSALDEPGPGASLLAEEVAPGLRAGVVVDALLGTRPCGPLRTPMPAVIAAINRLAAAGVPVLAVDVPSGLDADTGEPLGDAVRATATITFAGLKAGFTRPAAGPYLGRVVVADISIPAELVAEVGSPFEAAAPPRPPGPDRGPGAKPRAGGPLPG